MFNEVIANNKYRYILFILLISSPFNV